MPFASFPAQVEFIERIQRYLSRFSTQHYNPWVVVVELLLIGVVVYTVLRFLRGTRGARLVQAVLMILAGKWSRETSISTASTSCTPISWAGYSSCRWSRFSMSFGGC